MIRFAMVWGALFLIYALEPAAFVPGLVLWWGAYLIGRASRPREEPPEVRVTVEEVDLEVRHIPELEPKTAFHISRETVRKFKIARKPRTR